jgi:hypothetical protein
MRILDSWLTLRIPRDAFSTASRDKPYRNSTATLDFAAFSDRILTFGGEDYKSEAQAARAKALFRHRR